MYNVYKPVNQDTTEVILIATVPTIEDAIRIADEQGATSIEDTQETISVVVWKQAE